MAKRFIAAILIFVFVAAALCGCAKGAGPGGSGNTSGSGFSGGLEAGADADPSAGIGDAEDPSGARAPDGTNTASEPGDMQNEYSGFKPSWDIGGIEGQPYLVAVNRALCTVTVFEKDEAGDYTKPLKAMACSVGKEGHATPKGRWNTEGRYEWCYMVDGSYGRYAIRIYKGWMFHSVCYFTKSMDDLEYEEFNKLGEPASLGCVRLCLSDVKWLYDNCPEGFPTVIYEDREIPGPLGKPVPFKIDPENEFLRGWDPTDTDPESPWNQPDDPEGLQNQADYS